MTQLESHRRWRTALILATVLCVGSAAAASSPLRPLRTVLGEASEVPQIVIDGDQALLTLDDAIEIALEQNLSLELQRYDRTSALWRIEGAKGVFDLGTSLSAGFQSSKNPSSSQLDGAAVLDRDDRDLSIQLNQLTPYGGVGSFGLFTNRNSSNSTFSLIDPSLSASTSISYRQPLLRGFGALSTKRSILQARITSDRSGKLFEQEVTSVIQQVQQAYWALVDAREQLTVAEEGLALAIELDERNRVQVDVGTLAPIELVQSEATVATRQEGIITARTAVGDAEDQLLQLLNIDPGALWDMDLVPQTEPEVVDVEVDVDAALEAAYQNRPEMRISDLDIESLEIESAFFRRERLPSLDVTVTYGTVGLGGRSSVQDPETGDLRVVDEDLIDALDEAVSRDFDSIGMRLDVSYPLQNRAARANSATADLDLERARTDQDRLRLQIRTEVRAAARRLESAVQRIETARASRSAQERNLEAEQKRYENGMSTSYQVTEIQEDLTLARSREVSAITEYRNALTELYRATGQLLEETGVELLEGSL
ncbi:MAG: TolC family protein [Acidobacteriota bacterium]